MSKKEKAQLPKCLHCEVCPKCAKNLKDNLNKVIIARQSEVIKALKAALKYLHEIHTKQLRDFPEELDD